MFLVFYCRCKVSAPAKHVYMPCGSRFMRMLKHIYIPLAMMVMHPLGVTQCSRLPDAGPLSGVIDNTKVLDAGPALVILR
jgi:hypothetical protein